MSYNPDATYGTRTISNVMTYKLAPVRHRTSRHTILYIKYDIVRQDMLAWMRAGLVEHAACMISRLSWAPLSRNNTANKRHHSIGPGVQPMMPIKNK
jgi:hypothetical protein